MNLPRLFERRSGFKTPLLVKIGVIAGIWIFASGLTKLVFNPDWLSLVSAIMIVVQICALIAVWNLRKWGVYTSGIFAALGILNMYAFAVVPISTKVLIAALIFRLLPLIPAVFYWNRFTERLTPHSQTEPKYS
jgi:hypothetical protein